MKTIYLELEKQVASAAGVLEQKRAALRIARLTDNGEQITSLRRRLAQYEGALSGVRSTVLASQLPDWVNSSDQLFNFLREVLPVSIAGPLTQADLDSLVLEIENL